MKTFRYIFTIIAVVLISVCVVRAAFPTDLSDHSTDDVIEADHINNLEDKIGVDNSTVVTSLDYLLRNTSSSNPGHKHTLANGATDVTSTYTELNILDGITSSTAELNILDGATLTVTELNYVDGVTSAIQTQLDAKLTASPFGATIDDTELTAEDFGDWTCTGSEDGCTINANAIALSTDTTGNFVATIADAGNTTITVANSGTENAAITLDAVDLNCTNCLNATEIEDIYVLTAGDTIANLTVTATSTLSGNVVMGDDQYLYFDTARTVYLQDNTTNGALTLGGGYLVTPGAFSIYANADTLYAPLITFQSTGGIIITNDSEGTVGQRNLTILMDDGVKMATGGKYALIKADNLATSDKTFQFPNYSGEFLVKTSSNELAIDYANNRVGIATTMPSTELEVVGTITATDYSGDGSNLTGVGEAAATALTISAKVNEGAGISKGQCVYVSGATGQRPQVSLCDNTNSVKHDYFGIAAEDKTDGQTILVRIGGELTTVDTDGTGAPGTTESWSDGDLLYMSTGGNFTDTLPTSGTVEQIVVVSYAHGTNGRLVTTIHEAHYVAVPSGVDLDMRMGDSAGSNYILFEDYADTVVGWINSDGIFQSGAAGFDGQINIYSEQGGTDHTASLFANTAMTSAASFYLPADEPVATYLLNMTSGGIMGYDTSTYLTSLAVSDLTGFGTASTTAGTIIVADGVDYEGVAMSGDATIDAAGALTIADSVAVTSWNLTTPTLTTSATITDAFTLGLGTGKGLIQFDDETTDFISLMNAYVGIGTATPDNQLHIKLTDTTLRNGICLETSLATSEDWYMYMNATDDLIFRNDNLDSITFQKDTGNVGIGTTTPQYPLDVSGQIRGTDLLSIDSGGDPFVTVGDSSSGGDFGFMRWVSATDALSFGTTVGGTWNDQLIIKESGNVGIGTTTPSELFTVNSSGDKFTIDTSGNVVVAGTLDVTGTITGDVTGNLTGNADTVTGFTAASGSLTLAGADAVTITTTGTTNSTLPLGTKTLVATDVGTLSSLTSIGTIGTGTWEATDIGLAYGGTGATLTADAGGIVYFDADSLEVLADGTTGTFLRSGGTGAPTWATPTPDDVAATTGARANPSAHQLDITDSTVIRVDLDDEDWDIGSDFDNGNLVSGTADGNTTDHLIDSGADFVNDGVEVGFRVEETGGSNYSYVTAVAATDLTLRDDIFPDGNEAYAILASRFVAPVDGYYQVVGSVYFFSTVADKKYYGYIAVNGTTVAASEFHSSIVELVSTPILDILKLSAGDYVDLRCLHAAGVDTVDVSGDGRSTYLSVILLQKQ